MILNRDLKGRSELSNSQERDVDGVRLSFACLTSGWNGVREGESRVPYLESHRKEFRFHSNCRGRALGSFEHRSDVVLFILLTDYSQGCVTSKLLKGQDGASRETG